MARPPRPPELEPWQARSLDVVAASSLAREVLFSGGAALAVAHLHHRRSADLDFFFDREVEPADLRPVATALRRGRVEVALHTVGPRVAMVLSRDDAEFGRIDFAYYPYDPVGRRLRWRGLLVDSAIDIEVNKVQAVLTRFQPRDFVDLFLLMSEGPERDPRRLLDLARAKFDVGADPMSLAARLLLVHEITELPPMLRPVELGDVARFFDAVARDLLAAE